MFGSFFDPFGYVNNYSRPQRPRPQQRPPQAQRSLLDDFDPFGTPFPFSTEPSYRNDEEERDRRNDSSSEEEEENDWRGRREQNNRRNDRDEEAERAKREAAAEAARRREISRRRRQAQYDRARRQEEIRRKQEREEREKLEQQFKQQQQQVKPNVTVPTTGINNETKKGEMEPKVAGKKRIPHTLLKSDKGYIIAANIPGYPADAVQIIATSKKVTVILHRVHLALPDTTPVKGYPSLETIVSPSPDNTFEIMLPYPISVDDSDATLSGGRLLINLPFNVDDEEGNEDGETQSVAEASTQFEKKVDDDAEDWTGILKGLGTDKETIEKESKVQSTLIPITIL